MFYTFNRIRFSFDGLQKYLIQYCRSHPRMMAYYLSRAFYNIEGSNGELYDASVLFDKDGRFINFSLRQCGKREPQAIKWHFHLSNDQNGTFCRNRDELLQYLKAHPETHYKLEDFKQDKVFGVKYFPDKGILEVNRKPYKIQIP